MYLHSTSSASRRILVVLALLLFIVALVLVIVQSFSGNSGSSILRTYTQGYKDGYNAARDMAYELGAPLSNKRTSLTGTITDITGTVLTIKAKGLFLSDDVDDVGLTRTVKTNTDTQIFLLTDKPADQLSSEQNAFNKAFKAYKPSSDEPPPVPPSTKNETEISFSDLNVGDQITVTGSDNENLVPLQSFNASVISKQEENVLPESGPTDEPSMEAIDPDEAS